MVRDERDDMPMAGCQFEGMKLPVPSCDDLNKKDKTSLKEGCRSKFFISLPKNLETKNYKKTEQCVDQKTTTEAQQAGPSAATCRAHGVDLGTICNAHDMARLGQFVSRWGKHKYQNAKWNCTHYFTLFIIRQIFFSFF